MLILRTGRLRDDSIFQVGASHEAIDRLNRTCFRPFRPKAGIFIHWRSPGEWMEDHLVYQSILRIADEWQERRSQIPLHRTTVNHYASVGWSITDQLCNYEERTLRLFRPNEFSIALQVCPWRTNLLAPPTKDFTVIFRLDRCDKTVTARILLVYPGPDFGEFRGNVSAREQVVFFSLRHPGSMR